MDAAQRSLIDRLLEENRAMTLATNRPDGWPQATTVGFAYEGLTLYFLCALESQKAANLERDDRVSLTIGQDTPQVLQIQGLSMAGHARRITDLAEGQKVLDLIMSRYPEQAGFDLPVPPPSAVALYAVTPVVISILDYTKGFAHTELVTC